MMRPMLSMNPSPLHSLRRHALGLLVMLAAVFVLLGSTARDGLAQDLNQSEHLNIPSNLQVPIDLTPNVASYIDPTGEMMLSDIEALDDAAFSRSETIPSFGYTTDIIWHQLAFHVEDAFVRQPVIEVAPTYLDFIDVFLFRDGNSTTIWQANLGDNTPASLRPLSSAAQIVALPLLEPGDYRMIIRVESNSANFLRLKLWPTNDLISSLTLRGLATNIFFGLIVTLGLAYFALGLMVRDFVVTVYGVWVGTVSTTVAIVNGLLLSAVRPEAPWVNDLGLGLVVIISYSVTVLLWIHILDLRTRLPVLYKLGIVYACVIFGFAIGTTNDLYTVFGTYIVPSHSAFMVLMCMLLAWRVIIEWRNLFWWSYLVLLALPTIPAVLLQLAHSGITETTAARIDLHQFSLLFHLVGMAILMAVRLSQMDRERQNITIKAAATTTLVEEQRNLISMLSHEFRTPLAVIQRSAEMLTLRLRGRKDDAIDRLERIQMQARKLARLVDIFLTKDGIDDRELSLARELVAVNKFIYDFVGNTTREGAELKVTCHQTAECEAYIDETLIGLAMTNLIETARRFAHGDPVHIEVYRRNDALIEIVIPCKGAELDTDEVRLIGDALFRRDAETKSLRKALGLHISQRIVDAHGGSVRLRDRGTQGIELCLILPCEKDLDDITPSV